MPFIPHTKQDEKEMLSTIGVDSIETLFEEIPAQLRLKNTLTLPEQLNEMDLGRLMRTRAKADERALCFLGAGAYEHHIPAAVWEITGRGEFMTAYTPYQAEASQGTLQLLYEFQTMMASLMSLDISNASMYDGASALAEAVLMTVRLQRKNTSHKIFIPQTLNPLYREVVNTIASQQDIDLVEIPYDKETGRLSTEFLKKADTTNLTAFIIPQPNFFGVLEDVDALTDWAHEKNAYVIGVVNPLSMALLKPPGQWGSQGADIAAGEGQPLGVPLASGGPYYGFLCCKQDLVRQLPGRIVGRTVDKSGKPGFVLTLQAREQHIRRAKANSNICTNQGLLVTASTIYMSLLGPEGLKKVALACHENLTLLKDKLAQFSAIKMLFSAPSFHELVLQFNQPVEPILQALAKQGIQAGVNLKPYYPELGESLLVCVTETKTAEEISFFVNKLKEVMGGCAAAKSVNASMKVD